MLTSSTGHSNKMLNRQKSSLWALAFLFVIIGGTSVRSYEITQFSEGCHPFPENHSFYYQPPNKDPTVTVEQCRTDCSHFRYSAVWLGSLCSCFEEIATNSTDSVNCGSSCNGDASQTCGSDAYMNVYKSEVRDERIPSSISTYDTTTGETNPEKLVAWVPQQADVVGDFSALESPGYLLEVSDGSNAPLDIAWVNSSELTSRKFSLLRSRHQYELRYTLTDADSVQLKSSTLVQTTLPLIDVKVTCPRYAATTVEHECLVSATGNQMSVLVDFGDGEDRTVDLGDTITDTIGSVNDFSLLKSLTVHADETYLLPNFVFKHAGVLAGFKFHAGAVESGVAFQVYRPSCRFDNHTYCFHTDSCVNINSTCDGYLGTRTSMCASSHIWSFTARKCVDSNGVEQYDNNRLWSEIGGDHFELVHEFSPDIQMTGWQSHGDTAQFRVLPGDMLAVKHSLSSGSISYINRNLGVRGYNGFPLDESLLETEELTSTFSIDFLVEAYVARPIDLIVKKTYAYEVDEVTVEVTLSSPEDTQVLTNSTYIDLQIQMNGVYLTREYCDDTCYGSHLEAMTNRSHDFFIPPHEGENPRYTIRWNDGTYRTKTKSPKFNHTFSEAGVFNITVEAMNEVSYQDNWTTIAVQDEIQNLKLDKDYFVTALDNQSTLYISIDQGTNVTYTITVYDMTDTQFVLYHDSDNIYMPGEHFDEDKSRGFNAYINYTFGAVGNWTMKVVAENCISIREAVMWFKVEVPIIGLDIIDVPPIAYGNSTLMYFSIINGTDISFYSLFDGYPTREWVMHEAGIVGHQYDDVNTLKATLIYNLMHDWILGGRVGPVPISVADAEEFGLGDMVRQLAALGRSPLEMLAGPLEPVVLTGPDSNVAIDDASVLETLEHMAVAQLDKAKVRCPRHLDGCSWHHGMAFITPDDYNVTGPHRLELFAENIVQEGVVNVSSILWVEYIIEDLVMMINETYIKPGDVALFNVTVSQLSRANTTIFYGDSHQEMEWRYEMLENDTIEFMHVYNESGNYTVDLESINNISMSTAQLNVTVQDPVKGMYLHTNSPICRPYSRGGVAQFMIYWDPEEALLATDPFIWISYGVNDYTTDEFLGFDDTLHNVTVSEDVSMLHTHEWLLDLASSDLVDTGYVDENNETRLYEINAYRSLTEYMYWDWGDYNISINVSNLVSSKRWDFVIVVDQNVLNLAIKSDIYNLTFGHSARFDITRDWGTRINLTWNYQDQHPNDVARYMPDEENFMIHTFDEVGVFWVSITAENSVGTWKAILPEPVMVQHPIIGFDLECELEMVLLEYPDWATRVETYLLLDKKYPIATNVTLIYTLDIHDENIEPVVVDLNEAMAACDKSRENATHYHLHTISHVYALGSLRYLGVEMFNLVSNGTWNDTLMVYEDIYNLTLHARSIYPEDSEHAIDRSYWHFGYGVLYNKFPLDEVMVIDIEYIRGSFINYTWDFDDGSGYDTYESDLVIHNYTNVGWYTVRLNASNPLAAAYQEITFQMQTGVGPVSIYTHTPLPKNTTIDMTIDPGWVGTDACYLLDFGIKLNKPEMHFLYFIGDEAFCTLQYGPLMATYPSYRYDFNYDQAAATQALLDVGNANFSVEFDYEEIGIYTANLTASNEVSRAEFLLRIGVTRGPCEWPKVDLRSNSPCLLDSMCATHFGKQVKQHYRSKQLEVKADIFIDCESTPIYHHTWWVDEIDPLTGNVTRSINNTELRNSKGEYPSFYEPFSLTNLLIPANTLTYGLYQFHLNVSMDREISIETVDSVYVEIVKSNLKAAIAGGGWRLKGWGTNVTFDALSASADPDYPETKEGLTCKWLCKRENETWPIYNEDYTEEILPFQASQFLYYYPDDVGGCFRDNSNSSGLFDIPASMIFDAGGCSFTYDFYYAYENDTIEFKIIVEKDTRKSVVQTFVRVTEGDPPEIDIESDKQCLANCGDKLNYAAKHTVEARVTNGRAGTQYYYEWDLLQADGTGEDISPRSAFQYKRPDATEKLSCVDLEGLSDAEKEALAPSWGAYMDFCNKASTGVRRKAITIEKDLFTEADAGSTFFLYVRVVRLGSSNFGETYRRFYINTPPKPGNCSTVPLNGTALVDYFNIECPDPFDDEHLPLSYEVATAATDCICNDDPASITHWKFFHKGNFPYSSSGGIMAMGDKDNEYKRWFRIRCFDSIGSWTDIYTQAIIYPTPADELAKILAALQGAGGDALVTNADAATNSFAAASDQMNSAEPNCTKCDAANYADSLPEDESEDPVEYRQRLLDFCEELYTSCLIEEENKKLEALEAMAFKIGSVNPNTPDGVQSKISCFASMSAKPDQLSPDAQDQLSVQTMGMAKTLTDSDQPMDASQLESVGELMVGVCGNTATANSNSQVEEQVEMDSLTTPAATARRRRRKKRSSGRTPAETQLELLSTVSMVGDLIGASKAAGETPSKLLTDNMNMALNKAWGDNAGSVPADDGNGFNLPDIGTFFPDANDTSQVVVSSQVVSQPTSPFVGKNDTSNTTLSINSAVVMLSLTNETGGAIDMGNSSEPTHVFIKREPSAVSVNTVVMPAGEYENDGDDTPFTIHKVKLPAHSSLHIRVVQTWVFNTTNCTGVNASTADASTLADCNLTSTVEATPQPSWLDVSTSKPTTVTTPYFTTTLSDVTTPSRANATAAFLDTTPNWVQEMTNKTGWILFIGLGVKPSLRRPETYITCELPTLNDPIKMLQREVKMNNVNKNNASSAMNGTDIPKWFWNLPANLERDLDTCFFSNSYFNSSYEMELFIGVKYVPPVNGSSNVSEWFSSTAPPPVRKRRDAAAAAANETSMDQLVEEIFYQMEFYTAQCKVWNHYIEDWETVGCEVGPYSSPTNTHCICTEVTRKPPEDWVPPPPSIDPVSGEEIPPSAAPPMSFGAALAVPTNEIDMSGAAFANLGENPLVFSFMVSLMCAYLCLCIWARSADVKDEIKASTSPLLDNDPRDKYYYEVIVYTGSASGSSTTAKVSAIFSGDEDETPPRLIFDDKKPVLQKGGIDSFVMAVPQSLGSLNVIRIWHDNSGKSPAWNLSRIQVTDLQNNEKFFFVLDRWLAVDQDDGCLDRVIPVAGKDELTNFNLIFWSKARKDITDGHIWFSIFGRPARSRFTRIQRLTCCLSLLFCTMFANILFYQGDDAETGTSKAIRLGPIEFTLQQLLTGVYASLVAFPVNLIIVLVFRYSGQRPKHLPKLIKEKKKEDERMLTQSTLELRQQAEYLNSGNDNNRLMMGLDTTATEDWGTPTNGKKKKKFMLPWWFVIVAYLMCLGTIGWCFYAVVSVAFGFGPKKSAKWLTSFVFSFFESVFCTQPIKVLGLAAFYALVIKSPAVEDEDERDPELQKDEVYIHQHKRGKEISNPRFRRRLKHYTRIPLPPSEEYLKAARMLRLKEVKMMNLLKEMALYLIFLYLLIMVGYGNRDPWANAFYKNIQNLAARGHWTPNNAGYDIDNVKDPGTFYRWLEHTLIGSYYSTETYDGERHWWTTNFSADYNSVPAGKPRLRLLRTADDECPMPVWRYSKRCGKMYSISGQDTNSYKEGWVPLNYSDPKNIEPDEGFFYNTSQSLNGFITSGALATYSGGGYVYDLSHKKEEALKRMEYLKEIEWIDPQTRAVFVEFNLYNSAINLFAVSYILFEFLPTGAVTPTYKVQIFRLDRYIGSQALTVMVAEMLSVVYFIYYLVREIKAIKKQKKDYFKSAWNVFEISVLSGCMFSVLLYGVRLYISLTTMKRFRDDKTAFHNFQMAAGIDEIYGFCISFILFAATIKFTKLLRFNKRIMTMAISMIAILKPLAGFGIVFGIAFFAFAQMSYMIFVNNLLEFSTFTTSMGTLFSMMLNKFDYPVLERANPVFAPIIFLAFVLMMTMILVNFLLTIILDAYSEVRDELLQQENEYEMVEFLTSKVKGLVGMAPPPKLPKMRNEGDGFVDDKQVELSSRVEELMDKFMEIVTSDPQQRQLAEDVEQRKKHLKKGVGVNRRIVTG